MPPNNTHHDERRPLLRDSQQDHEEETVSFEDDDPQAPRNWSNSWKYFQVLQISVLALVCPMASSITAPAVSNIQESFPSAGRKSVVAAQSVFVMMLGIGPLFLAPMSETFGRRPLFLICVGLFAILQIPTGLAPNIATFITMRALGGLFGSVGVANGGGMISDLFETRSRATVLGVYLCGPLVGPSIGPLIGGLVAGSVSWRWIFAVTGVASAVMTAVLYLFLYESRAPNVLERRKQRLEKENPGKKYVVEGASNQNLGAKIAANSTRAVKILTTQPIVSTMSLYQALVFSTMYSLYSQYTSIWGEPPYNFDKQQIGLTYLGPATGFIVCSIFIVIFIDKVYEGLADRNGDDGQPEYRLPMANIGAVFLPVSLFWFGWSIEEAAPWPVPFVATMLFGASHVSIFNCVQTYYIDAYESNAASALAAGAFLRSMFGGIIPLLIQGLFDSLGYGWGLSVFGFLSVVLMPAPLFFYKFGKRIRERFPFKG